MLLYHIDEVSMARTSRNTVDHQFWSFSFSKGIGSRRSEEARWGLDVKLTRELIHQIKWVEGPLDEIPLDLKAKPERPDRVEDVPFVYQGIYVVSDRVRIMIDEAGPGDCQFIPVDVRFRRRSVGLYWIMHLNRIIDCADPDKSYNVNGPGKEPFYMRSVIRESQVPSNVSTFRIRNGTIGAVMRDSLKRRLVKASVTGCEFYPP